MFSFNRKIVEGLIIGRSYVKALCAFHNFLFMNLMEHGTYRSVDTKRIIPSKSVYYLVCGAAMLFSK